MRNLVECERPQVKGGFWNPVGIMKDKDPAHHSTCFNEDSFQLSLPSAFAQMVRLFRDKQNSANNHSSLWKGVWWRK